ncbi:M48 family metallopeptidase, partial [Streptomyces sp. UH6]|uniref:M48 family metallopeptidase n=1 Tax=Streptomyces sp. UH6 TaxID=2748379 RepID=UPI001C550F7B
MAWSIGGMVGSAAYFVRGGDLRALTGSIACASADTAERTVPLAVPPDCDPPSVGSDFAFELAALAALALVVGVTYWLLPVHRLRHRRLRPLRAEAHPEVERLLTALVARAGLRCRVRFVVDWRDRRPAGLAFGRVGRRHVMLSGGLLRLHRLDPQAFEAIVLHELAHLRNRDVDIAFLTLICNRLFLVAFAAPTAVLAPFALLVGVMLFPGLLPYQLLGIVTQCALAVTVAHTSSAVLRSRELYADARVALWTSGAHPLRRLLATQHGIESAGRRPPLFLRTHPSAARRLRALDDTRLLFGMSTWEAFGLALSCSLVYQQVAQWAEQATGLARPGSALSAVVPSLLLGGGLAAGVWRVTLAAHVRHTRWAGAHRTGLAVGGGLVLGALGDEEHRTALSMGIADSVLVGLTWSLLLCAVGYAFVRWNAVTARVWAPVVLSSRRPALPVLAGCAAGVVLLSFWLGHAYDAGQPGFDLLPLPAPLDTLPSPFDYLGMVFALAVVTTPAPGVLAVVGLTVGLPLAAGAGERFSRRR